MRVLALLLLAFSTLAGPASAERTVMALSQEEVGISATFDGTDILVYGGITLETGETRPAGPLGVIVTVDGPPAIATVRRKTSVGGIWINSDAGRYVPVPSFYSVASTAPLDRLVTPEEDRLYAIGIAARVRSVTVRRPTGEAEQFDEALQRIGLRDGRFRLRPDGVELRSGTLFQASFSLPATISNGDYVVRVFLTRDGQVIDASRRVFAVKKAPVERFVFQLAKENGTLYGVLCVVLAVAAGWLASVVVGLIRKR